MRVLLYHCPEAPEGLAWIGQIWLAPGDPARVAPKEALFGIRFTGDDPEGVRAKVEAFWKKEVTDKAAAKPAKPKPVKFTPKVYDPDPLIEDDEEGV